MKLTTGSTIPNFTYETPWQQGKNLYDTVGQQKTFLLFLRDYGCTICQLDMRNLKAQYDSILKKGGKALVVLQSKPEGIAKQVEENYYPFEIICDPEQTLYKQFEITPAKSKLGLASIGTIQKMNQAKKEGLVHGEYEGEELQLPAAFLIGPGGKVLYARYAKNLADMPLPADMAAML